MDYEKKYKETLERARNLHKDAIDMGENIRAKQCEIIFPELKESEDERIRKALIKAVSRTHKGNKLFGTDVTREEALAWLEKQGEQKSLTIDIKSMVDSYEQRLIKNGGVSNSPLVNMCVVAFQHGVENTLDELHLKQILANSYKTCKDEWNAEKKELKKIPQRMVSAEAKEALYDKPAWSEEDERILDALITSLNNEVFSGRLETLKSIGVSLVIDWLKSLKSRIERQ